MSEDDAMNQIIEMELEQVNSNIREDYNYLRKDINIEDSFEFNDLFSTMMRMYPHKIFNLVNVISDEMNIPEDKFYRRLDDTIKGKLKNYAMNNYNTRYYENKEREKIHLKLRKKGRLSEIHHSIEELFE